MFFVGWLLEGRNVLDLRTGSWTFILGDSAGLPTTTFFLTMAFRRAPSIVTPIWMFAACAVMGIIACLVFRQFDNGQYTVLQLLSPTKLLHDWTAYSVLFGYLVGLEIWGLWHDKTRPLSLIALFGFAFWLAMGVADSFRTNPSPHIPYHWP